MSRKWVLLIVFACLVLISGCWSNDELTDLSIVSAYALDTNEDGQYVVTYQLINPENVPGALQGGATGENSPVTTYTMTGDNLVDLNLRASSFLSRRPYYAHTNLLVINEEIAREENLAVLIDALERGLEFRTATTMIIVRDIQAGDFVKVLTGSETLPAKQVSQTLELNETFNGSNINTNIREVIQSMVSPGKEPLVGGFSMIGDVEKGLKTDSLQSTVLNALPEANGMAVFKEGKLINWLDGEKARGTLWVLDRIQTTPVNIGWENKEEAIAYQVIREQTNVSAQMKEGHPSISVDIRAEGDLRNVEVPIDLTDPHVIQNIEQKLESDIKKVVESAIDEAQANKTDVFGFGEALHQSEPNVWRSLEQEWHDVTFPELDVEVTVDAFVRRTGVRDNPALLDLEKINE